MRRTITPVLRMVPSFRIPIAAAALLVLAAEAAVAQHTRTRAGSVVGSVVGSVTDASTGTPIAAAQVRLVEVHRGEPTHDDGGFDFHGVPPGDWTLTVQRLGYRLVTRRVTVAAGDTTRLRITMEAAALQLAPSVITGTDRERSAAEAPSPTTVLTGAELDRRLDGTVASSLQSQPGVSVTSIGPATARPVIRGLGGDRILVLEDGLRPGDLSSTSGDHAVAVEPLTAERLEVVRGPMSLLYGSSALGGIVNVVREEVPTSRPEHAHGALTAQGTTVNRGATIGGYGTTRLGRFAVRGEGSARTSGDVRTPVGDLVNTQAETYNVAAGLATVGDWGHAGASYRWYANDYGIPGGFVGGHETGVDITMRRHMLRAEGELHPGRGPFSSVRASGAYTDYTHTEFEPSGGVGTRFGQDFFAGDLLARHESLGPFASGAVGARVQYRDIVTGGTLRTPSTDDWSVAGFVVEEHGAGPLRLQGGLRLDWARYTPRERTTIVVGGERVPVRARQFGSWSASFGALWEVADGVRVGTNLSRAYRTPDFNELYSNGPHLAANSYDVGDPNLDEETGYGLDAFVRVTRGQLRAEVAAFGNRLDDYIFPSSRGRAELGTQGGRPRFQYTNEDARFTGLEGSAEWLVTPSLVVEGSASYVRGRFTSDRDPIPVITATDTSFIAASQNVPLMPPLNGWLGVRWDRVRWFAGVGTRYAARQDALGDFETETAGYALLNLSAGWRFTVGSRLHSVTLRADNALDAEYRDHLSRIKELMPEPGRNVSLLYRLTF